LRDKGVEGTEKGLEAASELAKLAKGVRTGAKVGGKALGVLGKGLAVRSAYENIKETGLL